jgi:hypothetical protein
VNPGQRQPTVAKPLWPIRFREAPLPHKARSFTALPGPEQARSLLADIATKPCPFDPVGADRPIALYGAGNFGVLAGDSSRPSVKTSTSLSIAALPASRNGWNGPASA